MVAPEVKSELARREPFEYRDNVLDEQGYPSIVDAEGCVVASLSADGIDDEFSGESMEVYGALLAAAPTLQRSLADILKRIEAREPLDLDFAQEALDRSRGDLSGYQTVGLTIQQRYEIAHILEKVAKEGMEEPRDLDAALDAIQSILF